MNGDDLRTAVRACTSFMRDFHDADWHEARVPDLDWSAHQALDHMFAGTVWYSLDLASGPVQVEAMQVGLRTDASPAAALDTLDAAGDGLACVIDGVPDGWRGYHPFGRADASGFAGMACDELLVHTHDVAGAFGATFTPGTSLCERVVRRLFPWAPEDGAGDAWAVLLWANGRAELPGRARVGPRWRWHCAPLAEWDGTNPNDG